jgi:altronate dehydratase large subunit
MDTFTGYLRQNGQVGIRNDLLILNLTGLTSKVAERIHQNLNHSKLVSFEYGMGLLNKDKEISQNVFIGLSLNPNVGGVLLVSADQSRTEIVIEQLKKNKKPFRSILLGDVGSDPLEMINTAIKQGAEILKEITEIKKNQFRLEKICLSVECGLSDSTSGLFANPLIGRISDKIISSGGTVIIGETMEWLGVESDLAKRAMSSNVRNQIEKIVLRREKLAIDNGLDLIGINPNPKNIEGGLSTIEEKAIGSSIKAGSSKIEGVLEYGEIPKKSGLWLMDAPSYTPESLTGFASAGSQINLFSTGSGNCYSSDLMPTIRITANPETASRLSHQIDHDCSDLIRDGNFNKAENKLLEDLVSVLNGKLCYGEILGDGSETISRFGEAL